MKVRNVMSENPACCTPGTSLVEVARMMLDGDFGAIPVVADLTFMVPVGIITDRDIITRLLARGISPMGRSVSDAASLEPLCVSPETLIRKAINIMRRRQVRRLIITNHGRRCVGVLSQADIVRNVRGDEAGRLVRNISEPQIRPEVSGCHRPVEQTQKLVEV